MQHQTVPASGFLRQRDILDHLVPVSASTLWRWVAAGRFPAPLKLSERVTAWRCEDVRAWLAQQAAKNVPGASS